MFTPTSEILNKNLEKKAIIPDKRALLASAEPVEDLYNLKLPQVDESNPAVVLDYNNETENVKVGYMSELLKDTELVDIASDFYFYKDNVKFDTAEDVIKYWMSDRTWKQTNTVSMSKELMFVTEDDQNLKQLANLKYLTEKWDDQPAFFRGTFETLYSNISKAIVDPLNLVGGLLYGQFAKAAGKKAFQKILADQIKKQSAKKLTVGGASIEAAKAANKARLIGAVEGGLKISGIDAALMGTADFVIQNTEKQLNMRDAFDPYRIGVSAITGGVFSFASTAGISYAISKVAGGSQTKFPKSIKNDLIQTQNKNIQITAENNILQQVNPRTVLKKGYDNYQLYGFNKFQEVDNLTKIGTGVGGDVFSLKAAIKAQKATDVDPSLLPAFRFRDTLASSARTKEMLEWKGFLPPKKDAIKASYEDTGVDGLNVVLKPLADLNEASDFMVYAGARRALDIYKYLETKKVELKTIKLPFTKDQAQKIIDYGELEPKVYKQKYNETSFKKGGDYKFFLNNLKRYTDFLLDYAMRSDILDEASKKNILNVYKNGFVPFYSTREQVKAFQQTEKLLAKPSKETKAGIVTPSVPIKKLLKGTKMVDLDFYNTLTNYSYKVVQGSDFNRANLSLVDMLTDMQKSGNFGTVIGDTGVLKKLNPNVVSTKVITENVNTSLNKLGHKITRIPGEPKKELPSAIDVANFAPITRQSDIEGSVLTVYRNGKPEFYEVRNPFLQAMYKSYGVRASDTLIKYADYPVWNALSKALNIPARILGRAITLDPLFQTANVQRDTVSGFMNSAFSGVIDVKALKGKKVKLARGSLPVVDTAKGLGMQLPVLKNILQAQDAYRLAIINGMGMSTRAETGLLIPPNLAAHLSRVDADTKDSYLNDLKYLMGKVSTGGFTRYADFVSKFEYATRLGEFAMAKKAGWGNIGASYAGREVATDFGLHGASNTLNWLSSNTIFLNAGLQGFNKGFRRAFIESGKRPGQKGISKDARTKAAALVMTTVVAPKVYLYFKNREYREYDEEKDIFKQLNQMVPIEDENGNLIRFQKYPMPYDYGIFGNIAEATFEYVDKKNSGEAFKYLTESFFLLMPFNKATGIPIPTTLEFMIEALINKDLFTGAQIKTEYLNSKSSNFHITPRTRDVSIQISNFLYWLQSFGKDPDRVRDRKFKFPIPGVGPLKIPTDPITIDFLVNNFMVGIYRYPLEAFDALAKNVDRYGPIETKKKDEIDILRAPWNILIKRNIQELPADSTTHTEIFFEIIKRAQKVLSEHPNKTDITDGYKVFDQVFEGWYNQDIAIGEKEIKLYESLSPNIKLTKKLLDKSRDKMEIIRADKSLSADEKRIQLDKTQRSINDLTYGFITTLANSNLKEVLEYIHGRSIFTPNPNIKN
tara:strand:- start:42 stop:4199 length:4158 start_codon:yes stop_codon:yes gene_type:complete